MKYLSVRGTYEEEYVDPEATGGWKDASSARKSPSVPSGPEMPPGYEPQAKNEFGDLSIGDGNNTAEAYDCGYRNPYLSDPNMRKARREEMAADNADGFVTRNNYWERM